MALCNVVKNACRRLLKPAVLTGLPRFELRDCHANFVGSQRHIRRQQVANG
ncbi:MAG: hypothetical protein IJM09_05735 [Neisseriaceae bacterium]|nr:hypothetical protein [Neisseriaceae bacterium]